MDEDVDRKARFVKYVTREYNLNEKCVPLGMSFGGIFAVKLAARYPKIVSCIYVDAPVVNYMSCPCRFYNSKRFDENHEEIIEALNLPGIPELLAYRDMPLDNLSKLTENKIPVVLVAGDSDTVLPYDENGIFIKRAYEKSGVECEVYIKPGCDHHPHELENPTPVVDFIKKHSK